MALFSSKNPLTADSVALVNVHEQIAEGQALLDAIDDMCIPGGMLLLLVLALSWSYGS
jgi:hypothetical protein